MTNITPQAFIKELLKAAPTGSCAWITTFACDPGMAGDREWKGWLYDPNKPLPPINGENAYISIAGFAKGAKGRRLDQPHDVVAIFADDVGTKANRDEVLRMLGTPSAVIETSVGNFQYWYFLDASITDAQAKFIFDALVELKASDASGHNAVRYGRLNTGINTKPSNSNFTVHLTELNLDVRRSFAYFEERLQIKSPTVDARQQYVKDPTTDADLRARFAQGKGRHDAMTKLSSRWAARGMAADDIKAALHALINESPPGPHAAELHAKVTDDTNSAIRKYGESRRVAATPDEEPAREPIKLLAFTLEELRAPLREEKYLIDKLIPTDAYSLIAGALSSYKTFFLIYLMIRRATGYDLLSTLRDFKDEDGFEEPTHSDAGACVLLTYEDIDWRIANRIQLIAQYGEQLLRKRHGPECANQFMADIAKNLRRVPLSGEFSKTIIVRGESGMIIPNLPFIDEVFEVVRAFTHDSVMVGLDPLRLAIVGSQLDDEIAQIGVNVLNNLATNINKDSGVVALSHATKEGSKNRPDSYIQASTHTSGSVVWSQHARSNFSAARLPADQSKKLFGDKLSAMDIEKQRVMELTHGRLSHGAEDETRYMLMDGGLLLPIELAKGRTPNDEMDAALPVIARVIKKRHDSGLRASQTALRADDEVKAAVGGDQRIRHMLANLEDKGFIKFTGAKTVIDGAVTDKGRQRLTDLERVAKYHESSRAARREGK